MDAWGSLSLEPRAGAVSNTHSRRRGRAASTKGSAMNRREFLAGAAAIGCGGATFGSAFAQSFPSNVIRIVVPAAASTPPRILAPLNAGAPSGGEGWERVVGDKAGARETNGQK